jgi:hypothetical protein
MLSHGVTSPNQCAPSDYYATDLSAELLRLNRAYIEFLAADGADAEPQLAPVIRAVTDRPEAELGIEYVRADELVALYEAARALAELEPANAAVREAIDVLAATFLAGTQQDVGRSAPDDESEGTAAILRDAVDQRRVVGIEYRAWRPGRRDPPDPPLRAASRHAGGGGRGPWQGLHLHRDWNRGAPADRFAQRPVDIDEILAAERTEVVAGCRCPSAPSGWWTLRRVDGGVDQ